jgi:drug/metabolite transporter (DMT)-like permease
MTTQVFLITLLAAFMHASWNLLVKLHLDRFLSLFLLQTLMGLIGLAMLAWFGLPSMDSLPYAFTSGLLHTGYNIFLARSYRSGDLSQVYPIARGTAPLLAMLATFFASQDVLSPLAMTGIAILIAGIWIVAVDRTASRRLDSTSLAFALTTSLFIAAYTIVDGLGGRVSHNASGYTGLVFGLDAMFLAVFATATRGIGVFRRVLPYWKQGLLGAGLSAGAYWIVIWAMTQAPIATVAALRETSILIVMAMSARYLRENISLARLAGGLLVVAGAIALRLS